MKGYSQQLGKDEFNPNKEKQFTSHDTQGPTDFDYVGFHLDTIKDIEKVFDIVRGELKGFKDERGVELLDSLIPSDKFDEITQYIQKLKRFIKQC
jgi:hypothetical protein|tara:strand:+ start:152 stop:436 length:285 start_codon:yes stop_codon:yes gene_type:complete